MAHRPTQPCCPAGAAGRAAPPPPRRRGLRWWWPTAVVAGFLVLVAMVGDRDDPAPGLSMRGLVILTLAAVALTA